MYQNLRVESSGLFGDEGIPHLEIRGVSARVELEDSDVRSFCRLAGFDHGYIKTRVRLFDGYLWTTTTSRECLTSMRDCVVGRLELITRRFDGVYIACSHTNSTTDKGEHGHYTKCSRYIYYDRKIIIIMAQHRSMEHVSVFKN